MQFVESQTQIVLDFFNSLRPLINSHQLNKPFTYEYPTVQEVKMAKYLNKSLTGLEARVDMILANLESS